MNKYKYSKGQLKEAYRIVKDYIDTEDSVLEDFKHDIGVYIFDNTFNELNDFIDGYDEKNYKFLEEKFKYRPFTLIVEVHQGNYLTRILTFKNYEELNKYLKRYVL